jgi:hypothetical protein
MKPYFIAVALLTMLSCQQSANTSSQAGEKDSIVTTPASAGIAAGPQCYIRISGKDTSFLQFETDNEVINGQLEYRLYEKDRNKGAFTGTITNNIIEGEYRFMSEGTTSVRPVVFKLDNSGVYEAIPSSFDSQGIPVFDKDQSRLRFDETPFTKGNCK